MSTILVADDSSTFREPIAASLRLLGHQVLVADNGQAAIESLEEQLVDLAVIDVCMPELNGVEVLEKMRAQKLLDDVPVIVLTSLPQHEVAGLDRLGDCSYLSKLDFTFEQLSAAVDEALERLRCRGASFTAPRSATASSRRRRALNSR